MLVMFLSYQFGFTPFQFVQVQTSDLWLFILTLPRWSHHIWGKLSQQGFMFNSQHNIVIATCQRSIASESVQVRTIRLKKWQVVLSVCLQRKYRKVFNASVPSVC